MPAPRDIAPCELDAPPRRRLAVLTCMDARIDLDALLGLELGDAHVIRNAGAIATTDVIRTIASSQRLLGTEEVIVIQHTDCGIHRMDPEAFAAEVTGETGVPVNWAIPATDSPRTTLALTLEILRSAPEIPRRDRISGFVLELETGRLLDPATR
ncbi:MAG: carbonic anhydrase [Solirubrobacteraceae bacterium]|nr:carbonic anhydrase [Solirubrobacteraceae bacterium]